MVKTVGEDVNNLEESEDDIVRGVELDNVGSMNLVAPFMVKIVEDVNNSEESEDDIVREVELDNVDSINHLQ